MMLSIFNLRSLILSATITVVLKRDTLLLDVVYELYTTVLDWFGRSDVHIALCGTLVHRAR